MMTRAEPLYSMVESRCIMLRSLQNLRGCYCMLLATEAYGMS
ncbi:Protein of unknown function [Pyronema omphalodes CBS 100304]|uniref:Uncharacterized protein n=1 Tax=Pyronema omphalodes (strain CBS 100304) TaxID=1076935 RepID=U4LEX9_PYROM|nr:Protein of unknown function [Pyronema omphalodes CBS 100304]